MYSWDVVFVWFTEKEDGGADADFVALFESDAIFDGDAVDDGAVLRFEIAEEPDVAVGCEF